MCGCMLMHSVMNHERNQHSTSQSVAPTPASAIASSTGQTCVHCGFPLQEGFAFCPGCGMSLQAKCPACGQNVESTWTTCAFCGSPLVITH